METNPINRESKLAQRVNRALRQENQSMLAIIHIERTTALGRDMLLRQTNNHVENRDVIRYAVVLLVVMTALVAIACSGAPNA